MSKRKPVAQGERFGRLLVVGYAGTRITPAGVKKHLVTARCDCGTVVTVPEFHLRCGDTQSCGCRQIDAAMRNKPAGTHYMTNTRTHVSWVQMHQRCRDQNHKSYRDYGGRGITVCDRWLRFAAFLADMEERPPKTSLDRIDSNGNYGPDNCRWSSDSAQQGNRRDSLRVTLNGETMCLSAACAKIGVNYHTAYNRFTRKGHPRPSPQEVLDHYAARRAIHV